MANEKTGTLQFQQSDGSYVAGYPKTLLSQVIGGQDAIDTAKVEAIETAGTNADAKYPVMDGTGATGTWDVSISGKAATAAKADAATTAEACTGNAATATTAESAKACTGNSATATKLATARTIALSGDATGSASFDGSSNITIPVVFVRTTGLTDLIPDNAGAHNSIYRGKSLGSSVTSAQWTAIGSGTFRDLFIGDYWTIGGVNWRIAAFDYWLHCGDTECTTHHVVIVPDTELAACQMNSTNTTTGGYVGSNFYTGANGNTGKATAVNKINAAFGSAHILSHREYLTNAVTNGKPTGTDWYNSTVELMNESMVYGATFFEPNPNGADPWDVCRNYTIDKAQLPLFAHDQSRICNRTDWWLRGVVSPANFAFVDACGGCNCSNASNSLGVRPAFGIKQS